MGYYLYKDPNDRYLHAWKVESDVAFRIGVPNPEQHSLTYFKAEPGETIWDVMRRDTLWFGSNIASPFYPSKLEPGQYYPRIARPIEQHWKDYPMSPSVVKEVDNIAVSVAQLGVLTRQLERICQTVQPDDVTFSVFGHDIRNLLILACTEVEAQWRGVLTANNYAQSHFSTKDYVKLQEPMRLEEYSVTFPSYPWLRPIRPFVGWTSTGKPTKDLKWYDAYNSVKHNRELEFSQATLQSVFEAVSACLIMVVAQFGVTSIPRGSICESFFRLASFPTWPPGDVYIYPYVDIASGKWTPICYSF